MIRISQLKMPLGHTRKDLLLKAAKELRIQPEMIKEVELIKQSVDARKKPEIHYSYIVDIALKSGGRKEEERIVKKKKDRNITVHEEKPYSLPECGNEPLKYPPVIIGMGPAGLFCGLALARKGYRPILLERGEDVDTRTERVAKFWKTGELNPSSNVQFGEGGAGTFSDGKLNTMVKDRFGYNRKVLETFVRFGAPKEILYLQKPHIGTDKLADVVKNMRLEIERLGGEVRFGVRLDSINTEKENETQKIVSVNVTDRESSQKQEIKCEKLILAIGHSARDTFISLHESDVEMQQKSFAIGVRVEHLQEMIGRNQYGDMYKILPTADYKLTHQTKDGRGVYSFCMCPGGYVVNASSQKGMLAVNGMSNYLRDSKNANSAMVVTVGPEDYESDDVLAGMRFQQKWEKKAYEAAGGKIPVQLFGDFKKDRVSSEFGEVIPETKGEYAFANVRKIIPESVASSIEEGITAFEKKIKGYSRDDTLLLGIESRTSSPVKILRDESMQSNIRGIYPCGEGAGYAGGITSAAMDGIKIAMQIKGGNYK